MDRGSVPIQAWIILTAAVVAVSSAGAVLQSIDSIRMAMQKADG